MISITLRMCLILTLLHVMPTAALAEDREKKPVGFEVRFHGVKDNRALTEYDLDFRFHGATEDWEYTEYIGIIPYTPQSMRDHLMNCLTKSKIETAKLGDNGLVIVGYRTPDGKLNIVKSVKITPLKGTNQDKMPTIKDTRPKA